MTQHTGDTTLCGFLDCGEPAVYRGATLVPWAFIARCKAHAGHHDFTERLRNGKWVKWQPIHSRDKKFQLERHENEIPF